MWVNLGLKILRLDFVQSSTHQSNEKYYILSLYLFLTLTFIFNSKAELIKWIPSIIPTYFFAILSFAMLCSIINGQDNGRSN